MAAHDHAEPLTYLCAPGVTRTMTAPPVVRIPFTLDQSVLLELTHLPAGGGRVHVGQPGQLADLEAVLGLWMRRRSWNPG